MENVGRTGNLSIFRRVLASVTSINPTQAKCSNLLYRRYDYANYLCLLHLPPEVRKAAFAIRAFNVETARVSFVTLLYYFVTEHYANTHCRVLDYRLCKLTPITRFFFLQVGDNTREIQLGVMRLFWWKDTIDGIYKVNI